MGTTNSVKKLKDKYANKGDQIRDNGVTIPLGDVDEMVCHYRWQFHRYLEQLVNDPFAPNELDRVGDSNPKLRNQLREQGFAGLTREQLWAKRDKYVASLQAGEDPYSSKVYGSYWIESPNKEQLIVSFKN